MSPLETLHAALGGVCDWPFVKEIHVVRDEKRIHVMDDQPNQMGEYAHDNGFILIHQGPWTTSAKDSTVETRLVVIAWHFNTRLSYIEQRIRQ